MERLTASDRRAVVADLRHLRRQYSKLQLLDGMLDVFASPPQSPDECIFAQTTECYSSDFERHITPCQFGGNPDCANCGCIASAGLEALGRHSITGGVPLGRIFNASLAVGRTVKTVRRQAGGAGRLWLTLTTRRLLEPRSSPRADSPQGGSVPVRSRWRRRRTDPTASAPCHRAVQCSTGRRQGR